MVTEYWQWSDSYDHYFTTKNYISMLMAGEFMDNAFRSMRKLLKEMNMLTGATESKLTPQEIYQAKQYPWSELMVFSHGKALCPFHEDRHPSFSVKNGRGKCWSCQWEGDTIAFWMEKNDRSFVDAVRALQ
jgi:hypothetical protein